ncbi:glycoside hydrolase family 95 protein [Phytoactinopolyspora halotolerans]|uniref:Glycoside hydrolase family 95 protein n=1 Tax=Phytoactinopolyspora halotolerans TaxID=1981512 RepID=A0A6L9S943_9ACTN|nr:glycoside hydrolase family 95 protein [Phytoactinopolyspora halotolerans]NEE01543.1 glycoside hydrolase family 95 protein [Phytoactinopolyspora halotolerans]
MSHLIWSRRPAQLWTEALPLGNGSLGAMVFGRPGRELIQINHETAWSGSVASNTREPRPSSATAARALTDARRALRSGDYATAEKRLTVLQHRFAQTYLPLADLLLDVQLPHLDGHERATGIRRELDLRSATHTLTYRRGDVTVRIRSFVSRPDQVLVIRVDCDPVCPVQVRAELTTQLRTIAASPAPGHAELRTAMPSDICRRPDTRDHAIEYSDHAGEALRGAVAVRALEPGLDGPTGPGGIRGAQDGDAIAVSGSGSVVLALAASTTFAGIAEPPAGTDDDAARRARTILDGVASSQVDEVWRRHEADHRRLYDRVEMDLTESVPDAESVPDTTAGDPPYDRLLEAAAHPGGVLERAPDLVSLLFHYGRYLLITSSYGARLPATLQGIWNADLLPPWSSKYTTNINLEMNYWGAETADLAECSEPLFDLIEALSRTGRQVARDLYQARGWVVHHNTDAWGYAQPEGLGLHPPRWSFWPMAGPWLLRHMVERLEFGADTDVLKRRVWPLLRSAAEFYLDWVQEVNGEIATLPSTSPENDFLADGGRFSAGISSTMDLSLIAELFSSLDRLARRVGASTDPVVEAARRIADRIPGPSVGAGGLIKEWAADPPQALPGHRHLSHLYFAFPGRTPVDPHLRSAISASLDDRGDDSTGWSLVWKLALRARLEQPGKVEDLLELMFRPADGAEAGERGGLYPNFFAAHPPFQIDGNLGFVGALAEVLLHSHGDAIVLLPALPPALHTGSVRGLVARPGIHVDLSWAAGRLRWARLRAPEATDVVIQHGSDRFSCSLRAGVPWTFRPGSHSEDGG